MGAENQVWYEAIWTWIVNTFGSIGSAIDGFLKQSINIDQRILDIYNFFTSMSEIVKILIVVGLAIIIVLGTLSLIKKSIKLIIVLALAFLIIYFISGGSFA